MRKYAAKRDQNEPQIIQALTLAGATVVQLSSKGLPDLLVGYAGQTYLFEVKQRKGKLTPDQQTFMDSWRGNPVVITRTPLEALTALGLVARGSA